MSGWRYAVVIVCILALCPAGTAFGSAQTLDLGDNVWVDGAPLACAIHEDRGDPFPYAVNASSEGVWVAYNHTPGDRRAFICRDSATGEDYTINATCAAIGEHCYVFVEEGLPFARMGVADLMDAFDHVIHPVVTTTFGSGIGIDRDPRVYRAARYP